VIPVTSLLFTANVIGENLIANDMPADSNPTPLLLGEEGLIVVHGERGEGEGGVTCLVVADDEVEADAIILRTFGDEAYVDSLDVIAPVPPEIERGIRNLAHAGTACADPDCEIHHPEVIEDQGDRATALAWFHAGRRSALYLADALLDLGHEEQS
jgi:hypothetical protein